MEHDQFNDITIYKPRVQFYFL